MRTMGVWTWSTLGSTTSHQDQPLLRCKARALRLLTAHSWGLHVTPQVGVVPPEQSGPLEGSKATINHQWGRDLTIHGRYFENFWDLRAGAGVANPTRPMEATKLLLKDGFCCIKTGFASCKSSQICQHRRFCMMPCTQERGLVAMLQRSHGGGTHLSFDHFWLISPCVLE